MAEQGVTDKPDKMRFELEVDGHTAFAQYRRSGDRIVLTHTEVPRELAGRGIGSQLASGVFDILRGTGRKAVPECTFMAAYVAKHADLSDLVEG